MHFYGNIVPLKISIITVTYNAAEFLQTCIDSVSEQTHADREYIIIDGGSVDGTLEIIKNNVKVIDRLVSEPDKGIYDAMNKGIALSRGDVIGILNADDFFASKDVLENINMAFEATGVDVVYGNLWYVSRKNPQVVIRKWMSDEFRRHSFNYGWMPAHPTFYARKELFERYGKYDLSLGTAADYELMTRFLYRFKATAQFLNKVLVHMRTGGASNASLKRRLKASGNDYKAMRVNGLDWPFVAIILKPLRKIFQYL